MPDRTRGTPQRPRHSSDTVAAANPVQCCENPYSPQLTCNPRLHEHVCLTPREFHSCGHIIRHTRTHLALSTQLRARQSTVENSKYTAGIPPRYRSRRVAKNGGTETDRRKAGREVEKRRENVGHERNPGGRAIVLCCVTYLWTGLGAPAAGRGRGSGVWGLRSEV